MAPPDSNPIARLPHAPPARLVTSARLEEDGTACLGEHRMEGPDPAVNAGGFFPGCLLVELMAQTAGLLLPGEHAGAFVAGLRDIAFHDAAREGERLQVRARLARAMAPLFIFDCRAETSGRLLASGSITLRAF